MSRLQSFLFRVLFRQKYNELMASYQALANITQDLYIMCNHPDSQEAVDIRHKMSESISIYTQELGYHPYKPEEGMIDQLREEYNKCLEEEQYERAGELLEQIKQLNR